MARSLGTCRSGRYPPGGTLDIDIDCTDCWTSGTGSFADFASFDLSKLTEGTITITATYTIRGCTKTTTCTVEARGNSLDFDPDDDGWSNFCEAKWGSDPNDPDDSPDPRIDRDWDGVPDTDEVCEYNTDPTLFDTDGDGAGDLAELELDMNPLVWGSQIPGEPDGLSPLFAQHDLDGDLLYDEYELERGWSPTDGDMDADGVPDGWEVKSGTDPGSGMSVPDPLIDSDGDSLPDLQERFEHFTDPANSDTDGDQLEDGWELSAGLDPNDGDTDHNGTPDGNEDTDGDGMSAVEELRSGTDAASWDTDGDGVSDFEELAQLGDPLDASDLGAPLDSRLVVSTAVLLWCPWLGFYPDEGTSGTVYRVEIGSHVLDPRSAFLLGSGSVPTQDLIGEALKNHLFAPYVAYDLMQMRRGRDFPIRVTFARFTPDPELCQDGDTHCYCLPDYTGYLRVVPVVPATVECYYVTDINSRFTGTSALMDVLAAELLNSSPSLCFPTDLILRPGYGHPGPNDGPPWGPRYCVPPDTAVCSDAACDAMQGESAVLHVGMPGGFTPTWACNGVPGTEVITGPDTIGEVEVDFPSFSPSELWFSVDDGDIATLWSSNSDVTSLQLASIPGTLTLTGHSPSGSTVLRAHLGRPDGPQITSIPVTVANVDLDIDHANLHAFEVPSREESDDSEDSGALDRGKLLFVGNDADWDGVPDFADGLEGVTAASGTPEAGELAFVPIVLRADRLGVTCESISVSLEYDDSDPSAVAIPDPGSPWLQPPGRYRIWLRDGAAIRSPLSAATGGDFVPSEEEIPWATLDPDGNGEAVLYLEALEATPAEMQFDRIVAHASVSGQTGSFEDSVRVHAARLTIHDIRAWDPNPVAETLYGLRPTLDDPATLWDMNIRAEVGGAITDGASICVLRVEPQPDAWSNPAWEIRIVKRSDPAVQEARVVGAIERGTFFESGSPLALPAIPFTYGPFNPADLLPFSSRAGFEGGLAYYVPPESYLSPEHNPGATETLDPGEISQMEFEVLDLDGRVLTRLPFRLRRPPMILVHGIKGSGTASYWPLTNWSEGSARPLPTRIYMADYEDTHMKGYDANFGVVPLAIEAALDDYRTANDGAHAPSRGFNGIRYAATRADLVGHSMGGQLIRTYISDVEGTYPRWDDPSSLWSPIRIIRDPDDPAGQRPYLRHANLGVGDIRRFISLGSPFDGCPLANACPKYLNPNPADYMLIREALEGSPRTKRALGFTRDISVAESPDANVDLAENSAMQQLLEAANYPTGASAVRWHPIACYAADTSDLYYVEIWYESYHQMLVASKFMDEVEFDGFTNVIVAGKQTYQLNNSDLVVPVGSQLHDASKYHLISGHQHSLSQIYFGTSIVPTPETDRFTPENDSSAVGEAIADVLSQPASECNEEGLN